jgi:hypothetical protein
MSAESRETEPEKTSVARQWFCKYLSTTTTNANADCLENQFTSHDQYDEIMSDGGRLRVQALLASVDGTPLGKVKTL